MISSFDNGPNLGLESIVFKFFWRDDKFMFYVCFISFPNKEFQVFIPRPWLTGAPSSPGEPFVQSSRRNIIGIDWVLTPAPGARLSMKLRKNAEKWSNTRRRIRHKQTVRWCGIIIRHKRAFYLFVVFVLKPFQCNDVSQSEACKSSPSSQSGTLDRGQMWTMNAESGVIEMLVCH